MNRRVADTVLLTLCATALPGCVAVAIPAPAGSAMARSQLVGSGQETQEPVAAAAEADAAVPEALSTPAPVPAAQSAATPAAPAALSAPPASATGQSSFVPFARYGEALARQAAGGAQVPSATLSDAVSLDGKRRSCAAGEQLVALIDLDPADGLFAPPAGPASQPDAAQALAALREAGVEIAWFSDLPSDQSGSVRTALEQSGLDPRGQDIVSLRREDGSDKDQRRASLGSITCILAIAGDERADFDLRYKYLRNPDAGMALEKVINDGWFLIEPLFGK